MENVTNPRRGRPRKNTPVPNNASEGADASGIDSGNWETGATGNRTQANAKRATWLELVELVKVKNSHSHRISCVIHPDAEGLVITENLGNIRTEKGECGYQLNTGEIIKI
jgi:hypothetical protein